MPRLIDYTAHDSYGTPVYSFVDDQGQQTPPMYGDAAEELRRNVDQYRALQGPDMRLADNSAGGMSGAGLGGPRADVPGVSMAPPPAPPAPPAPPPIQGNMSQPEAAPPNMSPAPQSSQQPAGAPAAPPSPQQPQGAPATSNGPPGPADAYKYINSPVHSAGTSVGQLRRKAASGVAIPKTSEETVEGAQPYDPEAADSRNEYNLDLRLAKQATAEALAERADRDAAILDQQAAIAAQRAQREQVKLQAVETGVQHDMGIAQEYRRQAASQQVDPTRIFSGVGGTIGAIAAIIGQGMGAYAATKTGGRNFAQEIVQGAIDRDIRAQEINIRNNRETAQNQLGEIYQRLGNMNQAKSVLKQMQTDWASTQMAARRAQDKSQDVQLDHQEWEAQNEASRAEEERNFLAESYGKHTLRVAEQFAYPQAGGTREATHTEKMQRAAELSAYGGLAKQAAETGKARAEAQKAGVEAANLSGGMGNYTEPKELAKAVQEYGSRHAEVAGARESIKNLAEKVGAVWDPKNSQWVMPGGAEPDVPGHGATGAVPDFALSQKGREFRRAYKETLSQTIKARSGTAASDAEVERLNSVIGGPYDSDMLGGLNTLQRMQDTADHDLSASYGPQVTEVFGKRRGQSVTGAREAPEKSAEEPYRP